MTPKAKPVLHGKHWVAVTGKPLAATAGAMTFTRGGNAVVPTGPVENGRQSFDLYRCPEAQGDGGAEGDGEASPVSTEHFDVREQVMR